MDPGALALPLFNAGDGLAGIRPKGAKFVQFGIDAGRVGFDDYAWYDGRLRQHAWDSSMAWSGNVGWENSSVS